MMMKKLITLFKAIPRSERRAALRRSEAEARARREAIFMAHAGLTMSMLLAYHHHQLKDFSNWLFMALCTAGVIAVWVILIREFFTNLKGATAHQIQWGDEHVRNG